MATAAAAGVTWRGGVVVDLAVDHLRDDGVADGQHGEELADDGRGGVVAQQVLVQQRIFQFLVGPRPVVNDLRRRDITMRAVWRGRGVGGMWEGGGTSAMEHLWKSMTLQVRVPVLSLKT